MGGSILLVYWKMLGHSVLLTRKYSLIASISCKRASFMGAQGWSLRLDVQLLLSSVDTEVPSTVFHHLGLLFEYGDPLNPVLHVIKVRGHVRKSCSWLTRKQIIVFCFWSSFIAPATSGAGCGAGQAGDHGRAERHHRGTWPFRFSSDHLSVCCWLSRAFSLNFVQSKRQKE